MKTTNTSTTTQNISPPSREKENIKNYCVRVDEGVMSKIKAIAQRENLMLKDLYTYAFDVIIKRYEGKHGAVKIPPKKPKGNIEEVLKQ